MDRYPLSRAGLLEPGAERWVEVSDYAASSD
jgi:hypothetical protein